MSSATKSHDAVKPVPPARVSANADAVKRAARMSASGDDPKPVAAQASATACPPSAVDALKRAAAARALESVRDGMALGLGTGSTIRFFLDLLGRRVRAGELRGVVGVPTSRRTATIARALGIRVSRLRERPHLDLTVDGADEVAPGGDLIKGLGGALLREKIVAQASRRFIVIVDESKVVSRLGTRSALPVEVTRFGFSRHEAFVAGLGAEVAPRRTADGARYVTSNGNHVLDARFPEGIDDPVALDEALRARAGIVENGLFLGLTTRALVAARGGVRAIEPR